MSTPDTTIDPPSRSLRVEDTDRSTPTDRMDRSQLIDRIDALECELADRERREQKLIDQYERLLSERDASQPARQETPPAGLLERLFARY